MNLVCLSTFSEATKRPIWSSVDIDVDIEPLELRREGAVIEMVERYKRSDQDNPNRKIVEEWKQDHRIQQNSILKIEKKLQEKHQLPGNRAPLQQFDKNTPPYLELRRPNIRTSINNAVSKKHSDPVELMVAGLKTVQEYPDNWIQVYTDGSAFKGTMNAGYGVRIEYADKTSEEIFNPCGVFCSNYEAEALAIEAAVHQLQQQFTLSRERKQNVVIFSDSMSVLQALENEKLDTSLIISITKTLSAFMQEFDIDVTLQWIPSHCDIPGNERADTLAKKGAESEQANIPVSLNTAKQMIKSNNKNRETEQLGFVLFFRTLFLSQHGGENTAVHFRHLLSSSDLRKHEKIQYINHRTRDVVLFT